MDGACSTHGYMRNGYKVFVDGTIILKWIFKNAVGDVDWIHLAQSRYRWYALVNTVMNLLGYIKDRVIS
jgi:hypothetical protein